MRVPRVIRRYRHPQLLLALFLLLFLEPFLGRRAGALLVDVFLALTLIAAVVACATRRWHRVVGILLTLLTLGTGVYRDLTGIGTVEIAYSMLGVSFLSFLTWLVLKDVFSGGPVDVDKICGALSAYLFMGVTWAFAYAVLEGFVPGSLAGLSVAGVDDLSYDRFIGFSFVTITTLGYGNIVPTTPQADALAYMEAIVGQIYLTVLVARLVALSLQPQDVPKLDEDAL